MITAATASAPVNVGAAATSTEIPLTGLSAGDLAVLLLVGDDGGAGRSVTPPPGWTVWRPWGNYALAGDATASAGAWARIHDGTPSVTLSTSSATSGQTAIVLRVQHSLTAPTIAVGPWAGRSDPGSGATSTTTVAPGLNASAGSVLAVALERTLAAETTDQITATPGAKALVSALTSSTSLVIGTRDEPSTIVAPWTVTYPNAHARNGTAGQLVLVGRTPEPQTLPGVRDGSSVRVYVGDRGGLSRVSAMYQTRPGISVQEMLAATPYSAHRGGSRDFPEMSVEAYRGSALLGWPILEVSLSRTSDGVWFGLHDEHLDRVVLGTNTTTLLPAALTWAQVSAKRIRGATAAANPSQPDGHFVDLETLVASYPRHVFLVDPKHRGSAQDVADLLRILAAHGGPDRFILKSFVGPSLLVQEGNRMGYHHWGYLYPTNLPSLTAGSLAPFSILGLPWDASQAEWDQLRALAPGVPIWAHICPDRAAVAAARAKGARGYQCSGVVELSGLATQRR